MATSEAPLLAAPAVIDYVARWAQLVERRRAQMDAAYAAAGQSSDDYWSRRAAAYRRALHERTDEDPFFLRVLAATTAATTVLDVGAGTGRHTLELAPHVHRVTAVDPSPAMLRLLAEDVARRQLGNVTIVEADWMDAQVEPADVVLCSHVLYPIADVVPFIRKLAASARQRVFVYLRADPLPTDLGLWSEFHGAPLQHQPVHMDLLNVLAQVGILPDVEVVEHRFTLTYASIDEAVDQIRYSLCLPDDDAGATAKLRTLLNERLIPWPNGRVGPEIASARSAIISWSPSGDRTPRPPAAVG